MNTWIVPIVNSSTQLSSECSEGMRIPEGMWMLLTSGRCEYLRRWAGEAGGGAQGAAGGEGLQELPFLPSSPWLLLVFCSWRSSFQEQSPPSKLTWCQRPNIGGQGSSSNHFPLKLNCKSHEVTARQHSKLSGNTKCGFHDMFSSTWKVLQFDVPLLWLYC